MKGAVRDRTPAGALRDAPSGSRPVILATLDVPITFEASELAVDSAVENGQPLIVANVVPVSFFGLTAGAPLAPPIVRADVESSLREPARLAASLGVRVERLRIAAPRRVEALVELVAERDAGLLVFGADPGRLRARAYARTLARLRAHTSCLVWPV